MIAAAVATAVPDTRALQNRTDSDGTPPDDGFDSALANAAQNGAEPSPTATKSTVTQATSASMLPAPGQGIAALLAKLASGATSATADSQAAAAGTKGDSGPADTSKTANADKSDDAGGTAPTAIDPLAAMAGLLPGLVAAPAATAAAAPIKASSSLSKLSSSLGDAPASKASEAYGSGVAASADDATVAEAGVGFTLVASSTHLAPVPPAGQALPHAADPATEDASKSAAPVFAGDATATPASAASDVSSHDVTPTAAAGSHAEPAASLPDGTLQSLANSVTSLAADVATAASEAAPSAAATGTDPTTVSVAPARSLTLQLTPGDLGSVTVRLHLTSNGLDVDLAVDDGSTLASISHARDELASAIGDNGYRVESLTIRGSDASSTSTAGSNDSAPSQSEAGAGQSFSGGGSGGSGGDGSASGQRPPQSFTAPRDAGRDRGGDGVFV